MRSEYYEFCESFTCAIAVWNRTEICVRRLLTGRPLNIQALVAALHLDAEKLHHALNAIAKTLSDADESAHFMHVAEMFGRLREYRNHYVHSLVSIGLNGGDDLRMISKVYSLSAKGQLKVVDRAVSKDEIVQFFAWCCNLEVYATALVDRHSAGINALLPEAYPEKPGLPPRLKDGRKSILER